MRWTAALPLLPIGLWVLAATLPPSPDAADLAAAGKAAFAARCSVCHALNSATGATKDASAWSATVARMIAKSPTSFGGGDQQAIVAYLSGRSLFMTSCTTCHGIDKADAGRDRAAWKAIVARMQKYAKGKISDSDAALIAGYLAAERPARP